MIYTKILKIFYTYKTSMNVEPEAPNPHDLFQYLARPCKRSAA